MAPSCRRIVWVLCATVSACVAAQSGDPLVVRGLVERAGRQFAYSVQHLPPASYPQLPAQITNELTQRGCLIPQTYQAHRPENVIQGSFQSAGSLDWAVLCDAGGEVKLLVFFGSDPAEPVTLGEAAETQRLQGYPGGTEWGFNWGIDPASPDTIHELQSGMWPRPKRLDHDAVADSVVDFDQKTIYHYFSQGRWTLLKMPR